MVDFYAGCAYNGYSIFELGGLHMAHSDEFLTSNSKFHNSIKVIHYLKENPRATTADISQGCAMTQPTAYRVVKQLLDSNVITQNEKVIAANGRQPVLYSISPTYAYALCIMLEKTCVTVCATQLDGAVAQSRRHEIISYRKKEEILDSINDDISAMTQALWTNPEERKRLRAICISVEADIDIESGRILKFSGASCFDGFSIVEYFENRYGLPTRLNKLLYVEALASISNYCRYSFNHYIYLHIGVGFGATIVIDQKIYMGAHGKAGELERLKTQDGRSWEECYSTSNLYHRLLKYVSENPDSELNNVMMNMLRTNRGNNSLMNIIDKAVELECPMIEEIMENAIQNWAQAIQLMDLLFDPEVIVIGGDISDKTPRIFGSIRRALSEKEDFNGVLLPAQYKTSLEDEVAQDAANVLFETICNDYAGAH